MGNGLIRLANWRIGFFRYWTRFGSKPRGWKAASRSGVDFDSSVKCCFLSRERHAHGVARHGAEMVDEAAEAVDWLAVGIALNRLLGFGGW
jgi:hypothetical protein